MARAPGSLALLWVLLAPLAQLALLAPPVRSAPRSAAGDFVGDGTNELAALMLQGYVDAEKNLAVSPLGYSALLALLAEGAGGATRRQLEAALRLPDDRQETRRTYRAVLQRLREKNVVNKPELRNWFYVYKNHSVLPEYREVLREFYLTDVKSVSRPQADTQGFQALGAEAGAEVGAGTEPPGAALEEAMTLGAMKEGALIESALQEEQTRLVAEQTKSENDQLEDAPVKQESVQETVPVAEPVQGTEEEETKDEMKEGEVKPEAQAEEEEEMMQTSERRKQRAGTHAEAGAAAGAAADGFSGLTSNALVGSSPAGTAGARMLLFNGMYFRGSWRTPFAALSERGAFYLSPERKSSVPMMRARGAFRVGHVPELDSVAVELPYEGERYALLLLLPNAPGGLRALVADLAGYSLRLLRDGLRSRPADVTLPCFAVESITRPIPLFAKLGVSDVFDAEKADLSGVSAAAGLYVQDLVQLVTVRVDNSSSALNHITSSTLESRTDAPDRIIVDRPFLYFVRDTVDNLVVVAGKVVNPEDRPSAF